MRWLSTTVEGGRRQGRGARQPQNGKWIAYQSNQSGSYEVWVQPFKAEGNPVQVSKAGGAEVRWRSDGRELYYVDFDERLMAVPISVTSGGIRAGTPTPLFRVHVPAGTLQPGGQHQQYVPSADGQRFLVNTLLPEQDQAPITIVLNWKP